MTATDAPPATVCRCGHGPRIHSDEYGCDRTECGCTEFRPGPLQTPTAVPAPPARPVVAPAPAAVAQPSRVAAAGQPAQPPCPEYPCPEPGCVREFDTAQGQRHPHRSTEVDGEIAGKILAEAADALARRKAELDGQLMLDAEQAAEERERADLASTGSARDTQTKP